MEPVWNRKRRQRSIGSRGRDGRWRGVDDRQRDGDGRWRGVDGRQREGDRRWRGADGR